MGQRLGEHSFSLELDSRHFINNVIQPDRDARGVVIQGELGEIKEIVFAEGVTLEIIGSKGAIRIDISKEELENLINAIK